VGQNAKSGTKQGTKSGTMKISNLINKVLLVKKAGQVPGQSAGQVEKGAGQDAEKMSVLSQHENQGVKLKIEKMERCLHDRSCRHLISEPPARPLCDAAGLPVFDLNECPLMMWAPKQPKLIKGNQTMKKSNMYSGTKTWNPFRGCDFGCVYCVPSFQAQAKRLKQLCSKCYTYEPHTHPERLEKIPREQTIFVCGNGDLSFCDPEYTRLILDAIEKKARPGQEFYLQSKQPENFKQFLPLDEKYIFVTTLETNRDNGYQEISKAPVPTERFKQFAALDHSRKILTIEPVMAFDLDLFLEMIKTVNPEKVWLGINSRSKQCNLPEPSETEFEALADGIQAMGIELKLKTTFEERNQKK